MATVASQAETGALTALSSSVAQAGFPCIVVQPTGPVRPPPTFGTEARIFLLSTLALEPWNTQCGSAEQNPRREAELHRARLWRIVLDQHLNLLAVDVAHSLQSNPLPHIRSLDTSEQRRDTSGQRRDAGHFLRFGAILPDVVGTASGRSCSTTCCGCAAGSHARAGSACENPPGAQACIRCGMRS